MSNAWLTKADVLKDLGVVNGRRTGVEHLDQYVVEGERPPRIQHEEPDEDELSYFSGGTGAPAGDFGGPDLAGISTMLKMVKGIDGTVGRNEPLTMYHEKSTDEIKISKLNPFAGEYVPGASYNPKNKSRSPLKVNNRLKKNDKTVNGHNGIDAVPNAKVGNIALPKYMFKNKSDKDCNINENIKAPPKVSNSTEALNVSENTKLGASLKQPVTSLPNTKSLTNGFPKRQIEKCPATDSNTTKSKEIEDIQEKIKSTIIASSTDNSLQTKRQKNVAIATLLKMGTVPKEPIKLVKPDYFENPPIKEEISKNTVKDKVVKPEYFEKPPNKEDFNKNTVKDKVDLEVPSTSSSEGDVHIIDQDSISKVDSWFSNMECPKPKPQLPGPLALKDSASSITFKKKTNSSITSHNSGASKEKEKEPAGPQIKSFKPSSHASDLLKKYESNAQRAPVLEDLGTRLERECRERDERIKQKMLTRQNAG